MIRSDKIDKLKPHERAAELFARIEFISTIERMLTSGNVLTMAHIQEIYINIRTCCQMDNSDISRRIVKDMLLLEFPHLIEFHSSKRKNEPDNVTFKVYSLY